MSASRKPEAGKQVADAPTMDAAVLSILQEVRDLTEAVATTEEPEASLFAGLSPAESPSAFLSAGTPRPSAFAGLKAPQAPPAAPVVPEHSLFQNIPVPTAAVAWDSSPRVVKHHMVIPPPESDGPKGWYYPSEVYLLAFINAVRVGPMGINRCVDFDEARKTMANQFKTFRGGETNFLGIPMFGEISSFEEHRIAGLGGGRGWEDFVEMSLALRDRLYADPEALVNESCSGCREAAFIWNGLEPTTRTEMKDTLLESFMKPNSIKSGLAAAFVDANLYRCPEEFGKLGMALDLLGANLAGFDRFPLDPVENFIFDRGLTAGTTVAQIKLSNMPEPHDVPILEGSYIVDSASYRSALGWKGAATGGDTIGWRQLSMVPADRPLAVEGTMKTLFPGESAVA